MPPDIEAPFAHQLRPGDAYAPLELCISPALNDQFLFALQDFRADCLGAPGRERALVHPALLLHVSARTRSPSFRLPAGIGSVFARDSVSFLAPAYIGERLQVNWIIRAVYERRGRMYQALETVVANEAGRPILRREAHSLFFARDGVALPLPAGATRMNAEPDAGLEAVDGETVPGRVFTMSLARILAFSGGAFDEPGWPQRNIHTCVDDAREAGLGNIIASGTQSQGLLLGLLIDTFGPRWHTSGELVLRFRKPVQIDDRVQPMLRRAGSEPVAGGVRQTVAAWCENRSGERVIDGSAACVLRGDGAPRR